MAQVKIDDTVYDVETLPKEARHALTSLQFVEKMRLQKQNELAVADTARMAYTKALKNELASVEATKNKNTEGE